MKDQKASFYAPDVGRGCGVFSPKTTNLHPCHFVPRTLYHVRRQQFAGLCEGYAMPAWVLDSQAPWRCTGCWKTTVALTVRLVDGHQTKAILCAVVSHPADNCEPHTVWDGTNRYLDAIQNHGMVSFARAGNVININTCVKSKLGVLISQIQ